METNMVITNDKAVLTFNLGIYPILVIKKAVEEFSKYCEISFSDSGVEIKGEKKERYSYEFFNFLLSLMKNGA